MNQPLAKRPYNQVLVTGASRGLGRALARGLLALGHCVVLTARPGAALEETGDLLRTEHGSRVNWIGAWKPPVEWSAQEVISCVDANLVAPMLLAQAALPGMMARRRGLIVNIASDLARRPLASMAPYVASKHGLLGFSGSLLREAKAHGVKVSTVLPGIIDTDFTGALEGSKEETWALRASALADYVLTLFALPANVVIDELTIHPLEQDF